jgi:hypothetical protein
MYHTQPTKDLLKSQTMALIVMMLNTRYISTYLICIYVSKLTAVFSEAIQPVLGNCFGDLNQALHVFNSTRLKDSSLIIQ